MKKLLSIVLSLVLVAGLSVSSFAASVQNLGSDDFDPILGYNGKKVTRTVRGKNQNYRVTGLYFASESKAELKYVNLARKEEGLFPLTWDTELEEAALQRALEQYVSFTVEGSISHTRPDGSKWITVDDRSNGENLALGVGLFFDAPTVTDGWLNSPGHYANIMGTGDASQYFVSMAVACVETDRGIIWVQMFHADQKAVKAGNVSGVDSSSKTDSTNESSSSSTVTAKSITSGLDKAKASGTSVSLTVKNIAKLSTDAIKAAADWGAKNKKTVSVTATTLTASGKATQGKLRINPAKLTNKNDLKTGVYTEKSAVKSVNDVISKKYPSAKVSVIKLEQNGSYGGTVQVAAKTDAKSGDKLLFYTYDEKTGKLSKLDLGKSGYSIDKNKFLYFSVNKGGYIIVTDKQL